MKFKTLCLNLCMVLMVGCAFPGRIEHVAINFNAAVADTTNSTTLLNIMRAREQQPLHFTSISALRNSITASAMANFAPTINGVSTTTGATNSRMEGATNFMGMVGGSLSTNPDFDVVHENTKEFYQGITSSIKTDTIVHLLEQGWPSDLLFYLLVSKYSIKIEPPMNKSLDKKNLIKDDSIFINIVNDPFDEKAMTLTERLVSCYNILPISMEPKIKKIIDLNKVNINLRDITVIDGEKYKIDNNSISRVDKSDKGLQLKPQFKFYGDAANEDKKLKCNLKGILRQKKGNLVDIEIFKQLESAKLLDSNVLFDEVNGQPVRLRIDKKYINKNNERNIENNEYAFVSINFTLRSVSKMIHYVGAYIAAMGSMGSSTVNKKCPFSFILDENRDGVEKNVPLFIAISQNSTLIQDCIDNEALSSKPVVSVEFDGKLYWVPSKGSGRSLEVIELIQQLTNLYKDAKERPTTQTVRVL